MASLMVGIGDCKVSSNVEDVLVTHALGSCIAILIHDPVVRVAGLLHYMLPDASLNPELGISRPFMFADTGIAKLFQRAGQLGAIPSRMLVMAVGGAQMLDADGVFHIGRRNHLAMRKIFLKAGITVHKELVGGESSRTVKIAVMSGRVHLRVKGEAEREMVIAQHKLLQHKVASQ
jgi:chemotaxis protein CheD